MQFMSRNPVSRSESMPNKTTLRTLERSHTFDQKRNIVPIQEIEVMDGDPQKAKIIVGFPGIGKSTLTRHAGKYSWLKVHRILDEPNYAKGKETEFLQSLLELAKESGSVLLLPAHPMIGAFLIEQKLAFTSVYPRRDAKDEYLTRYKNRGSSAAFIELLNQKWEPFINNMNYPHGRCNHVELGSGQFLQDVFTNILAKEDASEP